MPEMGAFNQSKQGGKNYPMPVGLTLMIIQYSIAYIRMQRRLPLFCDPSMSHSSRPDLCKVTKILSLYLPKNFVQTLRTSSVAHSSTSSSTNYQLSLGHGDPP
jgi:hypothetical protein